MTKDYIFMSQANPNYYILEVLNGSSKWDFHYLPGNSIYYTVKKTAIFSSVIKELYSGVHK